MASSGIGLLCRRSHRGSSLCEGEPNRGAGVKIERVSVQMQEGALGQRRPKSRSGARRAEAVVAYTAVGRAKPAVECLRGRTTAVENEFVDAIALTTN